MQGIDKRSLILVNVYVFNIGSICIHAKGEDNERDCIANATLVTFFCKKVSTRTLVIPRTWTRKEVVFYLL